MKFYTEAHLTASFLNTLIALENISLRHNTHIRSHIIKYYKEESQNETYTNNRNAHSNNVPFSMESFILISKTLCVMCRTLIPAKANETAHKRNRNIL